MFVLALKQTSTSPLRYWSARSVCWSSTRGNSNKLPMHSSVCSMSGTVLRTSLSVGIRQAARSRRHCCRICTGHIPVSAASHSKSRSWVPSPFHRSFCLQRRRIRTLRTAVQIRFGKHEVLLDKLCHVCRVDSRPESNQHDREAQNHGKVGPRFHPAGMHVWEAWEVGSSNDAVGALRLQPLIARCAFVVFGPVGHCTRRGVTYVTSDMLMERI